MDAVKWTKVEPGKDEGTARGEPLFQWFGEHPLFFGGVTFTTKNLVLLDTALTMETQVAFMVRSAHLHLWRIAQLHPYLDTGVLTTLVHTLLVSRIGYCNTLYMGLPLRLMWKLQMVQKTAARLLTGVK